MAARPEPHRLARPCSPPATATADLDLVGLQIALEELLGAEVDVISGGGLKPDEREGHTAMLAEAFPAVSTRRADPFGAGGIGEVAAVILGDMGGTCSARWARNLSPAPRALRRVLQPRSAGRATDRGGSR